MKLDVSDLVAILGPMVTENAGERLGHDAGAWRFGDRTILITGAGGSIGSAVTEMVSRTVPDATVAVLDRDDTLLDTVLHRCSDRRAGRPLVPVLADIRDERRVAEVFAELRPAVVVHAAALKHAHLLEMFSREAIATNVVGTANVLEAAAGAGTAFFLNISTDKASAPAGVLGRTKLVSERLVSWFGGATDGGMRTASVRLCNVLGSRGSVLARMVESINAGRPVPVTHPDVSRYFVTPHDVLWLLSHALSAAESGTTLVPTMRRSTRIVDLVTAIGSAIEVDLEIDLIGLRPGDQVDETLWDPDFESVVRESDGCFFVKVPPLDPAAARSATVQTLRSLTAPAVSPGVR